MQHVLTSPNPAAGGHQFGLLMAPQSPQPSTPQHHNPSTLNPMQVAPDKSFAEKRITIWNRVERRKISGNAAPMGKNLAAYLEKHKDCEMFVGQDKFDPSAPAPPPIGNPFSLFSSDTAHPNLPHTALTFHAQQQFNNATNVNATNGVGGSLAHSDKPMADQNEKRVTIWHTKEKRKISGNAAPMEKNLKSYLNTHPDCEIYTCQDKQLEGNCSDSSSTQQAEQPDETQPVAVPTMDNAADGVQQFDEPLLTPPGSFGFASKLESRGIPITSPALCHTGVSSHSGHMEMSPVESLASSFQTMDFSMGSQNNSFNDRMKQFRKHSVGPATSFDLRVPDMFDVGPTHQCEVDRSDEERYKLNAVDDFGVMGRPDGF